MYLIPLNQIESVDLVIHALRAAAGEVDCHQCPVRKVCTRQCLAVAEGIQQMVAHNTLPTAEYAARDDDAQAASQETPTEQHNDAHLRVIK
ncbi:MAG: hypothetical protein P8Y91_02160 [Desulfuromonadales bacterium]